MGNQRRLPGCLGWSIRERTGAALELIWQPRADSRFALARAEAVARMALGDGMYAAAFASGRSFPIEAALADAIETAEQFASDAMPEREIVPAPGELPRRLSAREREVLDLLCRRYTASEIAERLFLSPRTVEHHVASLYNKLGVSSRRDAIAAAVRFGLV